MVPDLEEDFEGKLGFLLCCLSCWSLYKCRCGNQLVNFWLDLLFLRWAMDESESGAFDLRLRLLVLLSWKHPLERSLAAKW